MSGPHTRRTSVGTRIARTVLFAVLAAGVGAGAHFGWQELQEEPVAGGESGVFGPPPIGSPLPTEEIPHPEGRWLTVRSVTETYEDAAMSGTLDLATGDVVGTAGDIEFRAQDDLFEARTDGAASFTPIEGEHREGVEEGLEFFRDRSVLTLTELIPADAIRFITVLEERDETLAVTPIGPAAVEEPLHVSDDASDSLLGDAVDTVNRSAAEASPPPQSTAVRYYKLNLDTEGFAYAHPHVALSMQVEPGGDGDFEVWVDRHGIVRQYRLVEGTTPGPRTTVTLVSLVDPSTTAAGGAESAAPPASSSGGRSEAEMKRLQDEVNRRYLEERLAEIDEVVNGGG